MSHFQHINWWWILLLFLTVPWEIIYYHCQTLSWISLWCPILALMPTQALTGLMLISYSTQRPTTCDPSSDLCIPSYSSLSILRTWLLRNESSFYLLLLIADITENPSELIYHSYWRLVYSISTGTLIRLLIDLSLAGSYSVVLPIVPYSSHWTIATIYLQAHSHLLYIYKHMYICQRWSAFELLKYPSQLWISPNFNSPLEVSPNQLGDLYRLLCF